MLSVVIPVFNEAESLIPLLEELTDALVGLPTPYEIIFVDDGSADAGPELLASLGAKNDLIKVLTLKRNLGQTAAMMAGIDGKKMQFHTVTDIDKWKSAAASYTADWLEKMAKKVDKAMKKMMKLLINL